MKGKKYTKNQNDLDDVSQYNHNWVFVTNLGITDMDVMVITNDTTTLFTIEGGHSLIATEISCKSNNDFLLSASIGL